jgi:Zn-dependent peptidase ImmA (M78 family)/DNA-binding XRE family transcriptional regulator
VNHFAERFKSARKMSGLTLQGLADKLGNRISKQALNKYESGDTKPDLTLIAPLCEALGLNPDFFHRERRVELAHYSFRKLVKLPTSEQSMAVEKTKDELERYLELEDLLGMQSNFKREVPNLPKGITTREQAEQAAEAVRAAFNLGNDPIFNIVETLEDKGIKVVSFPADDSFSGMSTYVDEQTPVVVLNSNPGIKLDRRRFTAMHELAHLLLDFGELEEKDEERLCDAFAGAMLLPKEKVFEMFGGRHRTSIIWKEMVQVKELYGISLRAMLYRLKDNGIITDYDLTTYMKELSRFYGRKNEPGEYKGDETPKRFRQLLYRALAEEIITTSKAAALAGKTVAAFRDEIDQP